VYIVVGESGEILSSPNNESNWRRETTVWDYLVNIIYDNKIFVTVGANERVAVCDFAVKISLV
jgi:hypothetical protein